MHLTQHNRCTNTKAKKHQAPEKHQTPRSDAETNDGWSLGVREGSCNPLGLIICAHSPKVASSSFLTCSRTMNGSIIHAPLMNAPGACDGAHRSARPTGTRW